MTEHNTRAAAALLPLSEQELQWLDMEAQDDYGDALSRHDVLRLIAMYRAAVTTPAQENGSASEGAAYSDGKMLWPSQRRFAVSNDLLPCPFCNSELIAVDRFGLGYRVICCCGICGPIAPNKEQAAIRWNTRTTPAQENGSMSAGARLADFDHAQGCSWITQDASSCDCGYQHVIRTLEPYAIEHDAAPSPPPQGGAVSEAMIKHMVNRFLGWRLPKPWNPDNGISYVRPNYAHPPADHDWPVGTNLFSATEAEAMVRYMLEDMPSAPPQPCALDDLAEHLFRRFEVRNSTVAWNDAPQKWRDEWAEEAREIAALFASPPHPSATNNVSHPAVREPTEDDARAIRTQIMKNNSLGSVLATLKSIHAVIAEAGVAK